MADEEPTTPSASAPAKKRNLVPILIVVGVIVVLVAGAAVYLLRDDSESTTPSGPLPIVVAKAVFAAWQAQDQTAAAKDATADAVAEIFQIPASEADGLVFDRCTSTGEKALPKACTWTRPGGELTMTVNRVGGKGTVTRVKLEAAATTPTSAG